MNKKYPINNIPYGLVVRIPAFHAGGPGSIPGVGKFFFNFFCDFLNDKNGRKKFWFFNLKIKLREKS